MENANTTSPLSIRIRPHSLQDYIGQDHLVNPENGLITNFIRLGYLPSMLLMGPPGVGKTTLASIIARECNYVFLEFSATDTSIGDLRELSQTIKIENRKRTNGDFLKVVVFIDEIHRFSKKQQDFLLPFVEEGVFVFIGATTVPKRLRIAIASRCQLFQLKPHTEKDILRVVQRAVKCYDVRFESGCLDLIVQNSSGDTRRGINLVEIVTALCIDGIVTIEHLKESIKALELTKQGLQYESNWPIMEKLLQALKGETSQEVSLLHPQELHLLQEEIQERTPPLDVDPDQLDDLFLDTFKDTNFENDPDHVSLHQMQVSDDSEAEDETNLAPDLKLDYLTELATFYLIKLLEGGELPLYIGRKLVVFAMLYTRDDSLQKLLAQMTVLQQTNCVLPVLSQCIEWICRHVQEGRNDGLVEKLKELNEYHEERKDDEEIDEVEVEVDYSEEALKMVFAVEDNKLEDSYTYPVEYVLNEELRDI